MADYNDPNNQDKRLKQDQVEREKKATSKGLWAAIVLVLIIVIIGFYLYTPRTAETTNGYPEPAVAPVNADQNTMPPAPLSTDTTATPSTETPNTTPAPTDSNAVPPDVVSPSNDTQ